MWRLSHDKICSERAPDNVSKDAINFKEQIFMHKLCVKWRAPIRTAWCKLYTLLLCACWECKRKWLLLPSFTKASTFSHYNLTSFRELNYEKGIVYCGGWWQHMITCLMENRERDWKSLIWKAFTHKLSFIKNMCVWCNPIFVAFDWQ